METPAKPAHVALRMFLAVDATLLFVLGLALLLMPDQMQAGFHFDALPSVATYILGLLGCVFLSLGIGYAVAATDPLRNMAWIWTGIARSGIEALFGVVCVVRGIVSWPQAGFGIVIASLVAIGYIVLYPRS